MASHVHAANRDHSSSPKNTFTGSQPSPHTLKRSGMLDSFSISSSVSPHPSRSKLASTRSGVTDFGSTVKPFCRPHISSTCCGLRSFALAMERTVSLEYKGDPLLPRGEYAEVWMPLAAL